MGFGVWREKAAIGHSFQQLSLEEPLHTLNDQII